MCRRNCLLLFGPYSSRIYAAISSRSQFPHRHIFNPSLLNHIRLGSQQFWQYIASPTEYTPWDGLARSSLAAD
jgi:hypothetical protein